ncbi:MAG: hypothetical protein ABR585_01670 [Gemmatimonadaceae bacterium]
MITREHIAGGMTRECDICIHLFEKLGPDAFDYRPSEGQRSTLELLRYLSGCGIGGLRALAGSNWKLFGQTLERTKDMPPQGFPSAMKTQRREIEEFFATTSEETLATQMAPTLPSGTMPLGAAILWGPFKWLAAYKLQLFLYAKATGAHDIATANAWAGIDWKA